MKLEIHHFHHVDSAIGVQLQAIFNGVGTVGAQQRTLMKTVADLQQDFLDLKNTITGGLGTLKSGMDTAFKNLEGKIAAIPTGDPAVAAAVDSLATDMETFKATTATQLGGITTDIAANDPGPLAAPTPAPAPAPTPIP